MANLSVIQGLDGQWLAAGKLNTEARGAVADGVLASGDKVTQTE
jgi:hypothetical protein